MNNPLSARITMLSPSETFAMSQKSNELKAQGIDVINLSVGEPDFNTPDHIKAAAKKAIDDNFTFYSPVPGYLDLRKAICEKLKRENNLDFTPDQIVCSNGAKQSICNVLLALIDKDDEVIIPAPYWVSYPEMVKLAEGKSVFVDASIEQNFKITAEQLEKQSLQNKVFILAPSNPTGVFTPKKNLKSWLMLAKHLKYSNFTNYEHINYVGKHESIAQFEKIRQQVIVANGVSKSTQ